MNVLFFYVDDHTSSGYTTGLGIASIAGYLKKRGVSVELVYYKTRKDFEYAVKKIETLTPAIVGFYSTSNTWTIVKKLSQEIKARFPEIFQIYGGIHATILPETLNRIQSLDALCVGYGEHPMLELSRRLKEKTSILTIPGLWIRHYESGKELILKNPVYFPSEEEYDTLLEFDHQLFLCELSRFPDFDIKSYRLEIIFNRGCPFRCSFCCNHCLNSIYHNRRFLPSPDASIEALKQALDATSLELIEIHDDILTLSKPWFRRFISRYTDEIKLPFICNLRVGTFDEEDVRFLKDANLHTAWVGIESGNEYVRNQVMQKKISDKKILEAFTLLHQYDICTITQNIIGVPGETPTHFMDTIKLNARIHPAEQQLSVFYPYPKTDLYGTCIKEGLIKHEKDEDHIVERVDTVLELPYFSKKMIEFYVRHFDSLIKYQQLRNRKPYRYFIPLTPYTSILLARLMLARKKLVQSNLWNKIHSLWHKFNKKSRNLTSQKKVQFGSLRQVTPISKTFGLERGQPIDRYYIERFLTKYASDIQGHVLEIAEDWYTRQFGSIRVSKSDILHVDAEAPQATIIADLTDADHIPSNTFDCILCIQTLQCIYDIRTAIQTLHRILKPDGVLLATTSGISQISRYDMDRWGEYWRFTSLSAAKLFQEFFPHTGVNVKAYGNVLVATAFLQGLAANDLQKEELDFQDPDYEVFITIRAVK